MITACYYHSLRVHHEVNTLKHLKTVLDPKEYVFRSEASFLVPIIMDKEAAIKKSYSKISDACARKNAVCENLALAPKNGSTLQYALQMPKPM